MQGPDDAPLAKHIKRTAHRHLGDPVLDRQVSFGGQPRATDELAALDTRGDVVRHLHVDELGSVPFRHMINARTPLTSTYTQQLP
jgi:hypothetical protein